MIKKPALLFEIKTVPSRNQIYQLKENCHNFLFLLIRVAIMPASNLELGTDCEEYLISPLMQGFIYHNFYTGKNVIRFLNSKLQFGDYINLPYGIAVFGLCRINN